MIRSQQVLLSLALAGALGAGPALAASSASSASSEGSSASVGSLSTSVEGSSKSSKGDKVATGDYRILDVTVADNQPGHLRVALQGLAGQDGFVLVLPEQAALQGRLAPGGVITAKARDYGLEFASAKTRQAFFLAVDESWRQDMRTRPVTL